jgi:sulfur-oxidizing protein SoxY
MLDESSATGLTRRELFLTSIAGCATAAMVSSASANEDADDIPALIKRLTGKTPTESDRLNLEMPRTFPSGYTVPLSLAIDSPMTEDDHVRYICVVAPRNPLSQPRVSTRIRLAMPQHVLVFAELNDGTLLMTKTWVEVATNGCT